MKICVDPGHGMSNRSPGVFDSGATHRENGVLFKEADIALRYGLTLKDVLRARGVSVFMTRDDNDDPAPVGSRAAAARNAGCDAYISFHMNDVEDDSANGTETLFRDQTDAHFATRVQNAVVGVLGLRDRGIKERTDLAVLRFQGTAVLLELGFIGNDRDRNRILEPQVRSAVCEAIADSTTAHFNLDGVNTRAARPAITVRAASNTAVADGEAGIDSLEHDLDEGRRAGYDVASPLIQGETPLTVKAFKAEFGALGVRDNFNMAAFEELVRSWQLRHFSPAEFLYLGASHYGSGRCGSINSLPPQRLWPKLKNTAKMIDEIREKFGHPIRITSAYRDEDYNACVGGETGSLHMAYCALDFANQGGTLREMYTIALHARDSNPSFVGGIGFYPSKGFLHIDTRGTRQDWTG